MICFLCRCHGEIDSGYKEFNQTEKQINLELVKARVLAGYPFVKKVKIFDSLCLDQDFFEMARQIKDCGVSKVLICACASKVDEIRTGLKKQVDAIIEFADIREGCAWIHPAGDGFAFEKTCDLVKMAIVSLAEQEVSSFPGPPLETSVLVVGAGPAGLAAARALAESGVRVHLVEKTRQTGGMLRLIHTVGPGNVSPEAYLSGYGEAIENNPLITLYLSAKLISIDGDAGCFTARMTLDQKEVAVNAGAVILAMGARAILPRTEYRYRELAGVISAMELEQYLKKGTTIQGPVVFIQCVGVRNENRPYCSAICCPVTLKNAIQIKTDHPETRVIVFHRDMMCPGVELEQYYRRARGLGIVFIRFDENSPPVVFGKEIVERVECLDTSLDREIRVQAKTIVLSTGLAPHPDTNGVFNKITLASETQKDEGSQDFFSVKPLMNPVQTDVPGVLICGSARWPVLADPAATQGEAAAMKALTFLAGKGVESRFQESKFAIARVTADRCSGCGNCVAACPFEACSLEPTEGRLHCRVNPFRCTGCGTCVSVCPNNSIQLPEQTSRAIGAMLLTAFGEQNIRFEKNSPDILKNQKRPAAGTGRKIEK